MSAGIAMLLIALVQTGVSAPHDVRQTLLSVAVFVTTLTIVDTTTDSVAGTMTIGNRPRGIVVSGDRLYIAALLVE